MVPQSFANETALTNWLAAYEGTPTSSCPVLQQALDILGSHENYRCLIQSILANDDWIRDIAHRSVKKPQGFIKLTISSASAMTLRFHVYVPGGTFDSGYHNHCWDFASKVLYGALTQYFGTQGDNSENAIECGVYLYTRQNRSVSWTEAGSAYVKQTEILTMHEGKSYYLNRDKLHMVPNQRTVDLNYAGTVTLLLHGPHVKAQGTAFWPLSTELPELEDGELKTLEVMDVKKILCHLLNLPGSIEQLTSFVEDNYYKH